MPKILVIDDDVTALDLTDLLFKKNGFDSRRLTSGVKALETVKEFTPDIIIIDLLMPDISGQDTIKILRDNNIKIPIIAFTAIDEGDFQDEALAAGCNLVLTKPCSPKKLLEHARKLLEQEAIH